MAIPITQYGSTVYIGMAHYSVLKEILMITFSLWCRGFLTNLICTCAQKVPLVNKWVNYMPRKGVKLEIVNFRILLLLLLLLRLAYLTNHSTEKHETW